MIKEEKTIYRCEYCGYEDERQDFMEFHEACCAQNPINQPCSTCSNLLLGVGCIKNVNMEAVGGNVICFHYKEGLPQNPLDQFFKLDGNGGDNNNDDPNS